MSVPDETSCGWSTARVEDRQPQTDPRPERAVGEERQHLFLRWRSVVGDQRRRSRQIDLLSVTMVGTAISARITASSRLGGQ
jgi:hypothetical protein